MSLQSQTGTSCALAAQGADSSTYGGIDLESSAFELIVSMRTVESLARTVLNS